MSTFELPSQRALSASRTPLPSIRVAQDARFVSRTKASPGSDVARQRAWLSEIEAETFYANVPCTD